MNDVTPLSAKRLFHLTSPSPLPKKSIWPEEKPDVKEETPKSNRTTVKEEMIRPAVLETAIGGQW